MTRIVWGDVNDRLYEYGIDRGVLFPIGQAGVPWNGLISLDETVIGGESTSYHFDGVKYLDVISNTDFQATLTAISAPPEFNVNEGMMILAAGLYATQQPRRTFGLCYRTRIGSMTNPGLGYKLHLVYNCMASPSSKTYTTKSNQIDPGNKSWTIDSVPANRGELPIKPTAHFVVDSTNSDPDALVLVENVLYGTVDTSSSLPTPEELNDLLS